MRATQLANVSGDTGQIVRAKIRNSIVTSWAKAAAPRSEMPREIDQTGSASTRWNHHMWSSQGIASRGVSWHQPTAKLPWKASNPGGKPLLTMLRSSRLFSSRRPR